MPRIEMDTSDFDKFISKPNRRKVTEADKGRMVVGGMPPAGIHEPSRKDKDRTSNLFIKKMLKKRSSARVTIQDLKGL